MMNFSRLKSICVVFLIALLTMTTGCNNDAGVYQINDVVSDPGAYSGPLTLEGVVYAFSKEDPSIVGVMDKKELQCTTPNCKKALLAMKVTDSRVSIGDEIKASGTIVKEPWGYILKPEQLQVVGNHKLGGAS
jgi:hypothetical protein